MVLPHINPGDPVASAPINDIIDVVNSITERSATIAVATCSAAKTLTPAGANQAVKIPFDTASGGMAATMLVNGSLVVPRDGLYLLTCSVLFADVPSTPAGMQFRINDSVSPQPGLDLRPGTGGGSISTAASSAAIVVLTAGQSVSVWAARATAAFTVLGNNTVGHATMLAVAQLG